jgi:hypothetical protein
MAAKTDRAVNEKAATLRLQQLRHFVAQDGDMHPG